MNGLSLPLNDLEAFNMLKRSIAERKGPVYLTGMTQAQKAHLAFSLTDALATYRSESWPCQKLILTYNEIQAKKIVQDLSFYERDNVYHYPAKDIIFYSADVHSNDLTRQRMKVINRLLKDEAITVVCSIDALQDAMLPRDDFEERILHFEQDQEHDLEGISQQLSEMGYERVGMVEERGQFAIRGGILDIFHHLDHFFCRIEFFDTMIDSIRLVNPETQRSVSDLTNIAILPYREIVIDEVAVNRAKREVESDYHHLRTKWSEVDDRQEALSCLEKTYQTLLDRIENEGNFSGIESSVAYYYERTVTLLDYFKDPVIICDEPNRLTERIDNVLWEYQESMLNRFEKGYLLPKQMKVAEKLETILSKLDQRRCLVFSTLHQKKHLFTYQAEFDLAGKSLASYANRFDLLCKDLNHYSQLGYRVILLTGTGSRAKKLTELLLEQGLDAYQVKDWQKLTLAGKVAVGIGHLAQGFDYPEIRLAVISETEVLQQSTGKKVKRRFKKGKKIESFLELKVGDYVVHEHHGIGIFQGIETMTHEDIAKDFIKISYRDSGNLYMETNQLDRIQKYIGGESSKPKLSKLGGKEWQQTKSRAKKAVEEMVGELLELYAKRNSISGYQYQADTVWQKEFEELFPYDETEDQLTAIEEIKNDMIGSKIMDRLVCGDVGYGKTEVALRAAFKAIQDDKQVAYLVPTTILAQQHYNNFIQRFKEFPVKIGLLSRFNSKKEINQTLLDLRRGVVDMVVGTHRLLSKDVVFHDLGLLIIDEEQRFGVKHKETIKQMKEKVDVLTLTATPIPRTLHMSLIGIRDMSVLEEPPHERQPVQTYVLEEDDTLIKDAIYRELQREGQVYYVYNRVRTISDVAYRLSQLVPEARIGYAHGQMSEHELENVMIEFINGEIDVLVTTTIIETGLDIGNVNTIIIQDADRMGLSQLYQLRGRVGRSSRIAYAYLMYRRSKLLREVAEKRLKAIREFTEFGAGFHIAMRDLEIRGAGNVLGTSQSGHMDAIGYELYCKMIAQALAEQEADHQVSQELETVVELKVEGYIPAGYIVEEEQKLDAYKKIASIRTEDDFIDMQDELIDRYGDMPKPVERLLTISLIKAMANNLGVNSISQDKQETVFELTNQLPFGGDKLYAFVAERQERLRLVINEGAYLRLRTKPLATDRYLVDIKQLLGDLNQLKES